MSSLLRDATNLQMNGSKRAKAVANILLNTTSLKSRGDPVSGGIDGIRSQRPEARDYR